MLRAYCPGSPYQDPLFLPDLAGMLPRSVARNALQRARIAEELPAGIPYLDAVEAELEWRTGHCKSSLALCERARSGIDKEHQVPLRARLAVIAAECLRRLGRDDEALGLLDEALSSSPIVFRLLDVAIPVAVNVDSSPLAKRLADRVLSCPRFRGDPGGFPLNVRTNDDQLVFELQRPNKLRQCRDAVAANGSAETVVANALERLDGPRDVTRTEYHAC